MNTPTFNAALLSEALQLSGQYQPYAWATVIRASPPSSAYVGAQAIVAADGTLHGWVGGGCARDIVVQACLEAIQNGNSKLIRISNDDLVDANIELHAMPCASNGALDLFIQAVVPAPLLCIAGSTLAALAAGKFAAILGWRVSYATPEHNAPQPDYVLVATQGEDDAGNLEQALKSTAKKILLIASARKASALKEAMRYLGIGEARLADLESPAGPNIMAATPAEIALAAVAGLVHAHRSSTDVAHPVPAPCNAKPSTTKQNTAPAYINPVCLRAIDPETALHTISVGDSTHYFCCNGCKIKFDEDPEKYLEIARRTSGTSGP